MKDCDAGMGCGTAASCPTCSDTDVTCKLDGITRMAGIDSCPHSWGSKISVNLGCPATHEKISETCYVKVR